MREIFAQACPLCGGSATYKIDAEPYCKHFHCSTCVEFCIDDLSERRLKGMGDEFRLRASNHATGSNPRQLWIIRQPNNAELALDRSITVRGEFIERGGPIQ